MNVMYKLPALSLKKWQKFVQKEKKCERLLLKDRNYDVENNE